LSQGRYLHRKAQTQNEYRHSCLEWNKNPRPQSSSERRRFSMCGHCDWHFVCLCITEIPRGVLNVIRNYSFIHRWLYSPLLGPGLFFSSVIYFTQTVGFLGRMISPSQGRHLHTGQHKHIMNAHTNIHIFEWNSNQRSKGSYELIHFMPQTARPS
jgi:hypothetical protein